MEISYNRLIRYHTKKKKSAQDARKKNGFSSPTFSSLPRARMELRY
jgi:hypothetical protein